MRRVWQFVLNFARLAVPLNKKQRKNQPTKFRQLKKEEYSAMNVLEEALASPPILALSNSTGHMKIDTDACNKQVGCVLLQKQEDETTRPIGYWSHSLNDAEKRYDTRPRERPAVVCSQLILQPYLKETRFAVWTDQYSLKWILNAESTDRLARRCPCRSDDYFDLVHWTGMKRQAADALSCLRTTWKDQTPLDDD